MKIRNKDDKAAEQLEDLDYVDVEDVWLYDVRKLIFVWKIFLWILKLFYSLFIALYYFFSPTSLMWSFGFVYLH